MPTLHEWISQQVDATEAAALAEIEGRHLTLLPDTGGRPVSGTVTGVTPTTDGLQFALTQYGTEPRDGVPAPVMAISAILRRCEADRRILARHKPWTSGSEECDGCDQDLTTNINDCPELLDLAHAHGLTEQQLADLDRPQPPPRGPLKPFPDALRDAFARLRDAIPAAEAPPPSGP